MKAKNALEIELHRMVETKKHLEKEIELYKDSVKQKELLYLEALDHVRNLEDALLKIGEE